MIDVAVSLNGLRVSGHTDIVPRGFDIVCAAVSALTLMLIRGLREIALVEIVDEVGQGNICQKITLTSRVARIMVPQQGQTYLTAVLGFFASAFGCSKFLQAAGIDIGLAYGFFDPCLRLRG